MILVNSVFFQTSSTLSLVVTEQLKFSDTFYALLFTVNAVAIVLFELPLNAAMVNWSFRHSFMLGGLLMTIGVSGFRVVSTHWEAAVLTLLWTFGEMILFPTGGAYASTIAPPGKQSHYLSFYALTISLGLFLGPAGGTLLYRHFGFTGLCFVIAGAGFLGTGMLFSSKQKS